jgi:hypothetical protein
MRFPSFRRKHQKLTADVDDRDDLPDLTRRPSDESSGSDSVQSFDPNRYTVDEFISGEVAEAFAANAMSGDVPSQAESKVSEPASGQRQWLTRRKARRSAKEKRPGNAESNADGKDQRKTRSVSVGSSHSANGDTQRSAFGSSMSGSFSIDQADFDRALVSSFRSGGAGTVSEKSQSSSAHSKGSRKSKQGRDSAQSSVENRSSWSKSGPTKSEIQRYKDGDLEDMLRADTWVRRVSSLEACFRNESQREPKVVDEKALESVILKVISFSPDDQRKPKSRESSVNSTLTDDMELSELDQPRPLRIVPTEPTRSTRKHQVPASQLQRAAKPKNAGQRENIRADNWSVGSSSGDLFTAGTSEEDDETSDTPRPSSPSRRSSVGGARSGRWSRDRRSVSSIDDDYDDYSDTFLGGCNPAQPCEVVSSELRSLFSEVLHSRNGSYLNCLGTTTPRKTKRRRRSKK